MITKTLTGFMREEAERQKEADQSGANDYNNSNPAITNDDEAVHHGGYSEEFASGNGYENDANQAQYEQENEGGGLPARLPTESMNRPASVEPEQQYENQEYAANPNDEYEYEYYEEQVPAQQPPHSEQDQEQEQQQEQEQEQQQEQEQEQEQEQQAQATEAENALEAEFAALDQEMAEQYYYIEDGAKYGHFNGRCYREI